MTSRTPPTIRWVPMVALAFLVIGVAAITLLPIGWSLNRLVVWLYFDGLHMYAWPTAGLIYLDELAAILNVVLMVPLGMCARWSVPRLPWWWIGVAVTLLSVGVELAQLLLPGLGREASVGDVVTNAVGGFLGAGLAEFWSRRRRGRTAAASEGEPDGPRDVD